MSATHLYVVLQGDYSSTQMAGEIWQTGLRFGASPAAGTPVDVGPLDPFEVVALNQTVAEPTYNISSNWTTEMGLNDLDPVSWLNDQVRPAAAAWISAANLFSSSVRLKSILVYPIRSPDGHVEPAPPYLAGSPCRLDYTSSFPTGAVAGMLPPQTTAVVSTRTSQVGRRGRGRMFIPPFGASASSFGRLIGSAQTAAGAATKTMIEAMRLDGGGPGGVWVYPIVTGAPFSAYAVINQLRVGDVFDTQQRRRRSLVESFASTAVDPF